MGKIRDTFGSLIYTNEADVNQNFIIPLLTQFLGFSLDEIKPERYFRAFDIQIGVRKILSKKIPQKQKPDFIVCIEDENNPRFVVETKAITETLDNHAPQAISYASGVRVNFIVLTNGKEFLIFDVNNLIFKAKTIDDLDLNFDIVKHILSRESIINKKPIEIIQSIDYDRALSITLEDRDADEIKNKRLKISDFKEYLINIRDNFQIWQKPLIFQFDPAFNIEQFSPEKLLKFKPYLAFESAMNLFCDNETYVFSDLDDKLKSQIIVLIGGSGIGKTTALKYLTWSKSVECINVQNIQIPIYIQLRSYGHNNSLETLAIKFLAEHGFTISIPEYREYLLKNEFIFLLDALDEIPDRFIDDFNEEFTQFITNYHHRIVVTSRQMRIPKFQKSLTLMISPLDNSTIEQFLKKYLKSQWHDLDNQIKWKHLERESQNTLLLTLIIHIFQEHHELPHSRPQIINKIVENIKEWEKLKRNRFSFGLSWEIKQHLLSVLAFESAKDDNKILFTSEEFFNIVNPILEEYVKQKDISSTYVKSDIINNLRGTGLIEVNNDEISFWHRAFLEYFASSELANRYQSNPEILKEFNGKISWEKILLGATGFLNNSTDFISEISNKNIYVAALCVVESNTIDPSLIEKIRLNLIELCSSPIIELRQRGIFLLSKIDQKYPSEVIYKILDENEHVDVRQRALETIARTRTPRAREKVNELRNWDERSEHFITGETVSGIVAKALSNFGETEQLKIIEIWESHPDVFTRESCKIALLGVIRECRLSDTVKNAIVAFYYKNLEKDVLHNDAHNISSLIIEINDEKIVFELIEKIPIISKEERVFLANFSEILAGCTSKKIIETLISIASDTSKHKFLRECCAEAISQTSGTVSIDVFTNLIRDSDPIIRHNAVLGLDRFLSPQIKDVLIDQIDDESWIVQESIIEILAERGFLIELFKQKHLPKKLFGNSIQTLLRKIRKFCFRELIPVITKLKTQISDEGMLLDFSLTYCILGDIDNAKQIIESFYVDGKFVFKEHGLSTLIEIAPNFDDAYAFSIINRAWKMIDDKGDNGYYYEHLCIDSLVRIKSDESISLLKEKAILHAERKSIVIIENIFRSLNRIASPDDEEWYIQYLKKYAPFERSDYNRIIEGLGRIGYEKSEEIIKEISHEFKDDAYIVNACYFSLEAIKSKSGKFFTVHEEDLGL